jgi:hypothetical protein
LYRLALGEDDEDAQLVNDVVAYELLILLAPQQFRRCAPPRGGDARQSVCVVVLAGIGYAPVRRAVLLTLFIPAKSKVCLSFVRRYRRQRETPIIDKRPVIMVVHVTIDQ